MTESTDDTPLLCHRCGTELERGAGRLYFVRIEAFADPTPPEISGEDLDADQHRQMQRLIEAMRDITAQEAMDQVYRKLTICLCAPCYKEWIENPAGA